MMDQFINSHVYHRWKYLTMKSEEKDCMNYVYKTYGLLTCESFI
jgi:hypothetical protein